MEGWGACGGGGSFAEPLDIPGISLLGRVAPILLHQREVLFIYLIIFSHTASIYCSLSQSLRCLVQRTDIFSVCCHHSITCTGRFDRFTGVTGA